MNGPARNLLTGTLVQYGLLAVNVALGIFLMPFTIRHLGQAEYGLWMLVASLTAYFQLLDLGYGSGIVREVTRADARGDEDGVNTVLSTFVVVYCGIGLAVLAATAALMLGVLPRFPNLSAAQLATAQLVLAILGLRMAVGFPMGVFGAVTTARQRFALTGSIGIGAALVQGAVTYAVLRAGYGLVPLVAATAAVSIASYGAYAAAARHVFPALRLSPRRFSGARVRDVTTFSIYLFLISIAMYLATSVDNIVIGAWMGTGAIAVYTVAARLSDYQRQLCGQFTGFLFPVVVRFHAREDAEALRATLLDGTRIALALVVGCALCMIVFGRQVVELWMGAGFGGAVWPLYVLAAAGIVMVAQGPTGTILLGTGHHRLVAWASLAEIATNAVVSAALVGSFGLTGVAVGTAVPYTLLNVFLLMPVACRSVRVSIKEFLLVAVAPAALAFIGAGTAAVLIRHAGFGSSIIGLIAQMALVVAVYGLTFWGIGLSAADRSRYLALVRQISPRGAGVRTAIVS